MPRRRQLLVLLVVGSLGVAQAVEAQSVAPSTQTLRIQSLAATCTQCHGTAGHAAPGAIVPSLAGLPAAHIVAQMKAFQTGARPATVMHQLAKGYTDAQIDLIAAYFAAQRR